MIYMLDGKLWTGQHKIYSCGESEHENVAYTGEAVMGVREAMEIAWKTAAFVLCIQYTISMLSNPILSYNLDIFTSSFSVSQVTPSPLHVMVRITFFSG